MSFMKIYVFFGLEIKLMNKNIKWICVSWISSEDKNSMKKDKQYIMTYKSYMLRLPSTLYVKYHVNHDIICIFLAWKWFWGIKISSRMCIWKKFWRQTFHKEGQTIHHDMHELYTNTTINFIWNNMTIMR